MNWKSLRSLLCVALLVSAVSAAEEASGDLVEKVAVRNRLFSTSSRFELGFNVGFSLLTKINEHYNLNASAAYNLADWLAIEVRAGYAIARTTSLGEQIATEFYKNTSRSIDNDAADAWRMGFNGIVGLRFQPIYGKLNLMAELPVHFQFYLWVGGGVGLFSKVSPGICLFPKTTMNDPGKCLERVTNPDGSQVEVLHPENFLNESKVGPLVSIALGFRFFVADHHGLKLEVRDFSYLDSYYIDVRRDQVSPNNPTGGGRLSPNAGITNLVQIDLGYSFIF